MEPSELTADRVFVPYLYPGQTVVIYQTLGKLHVVYKVLGIINRSMNAGTVWIAYQTHQQNQNVNWG